MLGFETLGGFRVVLVVGVNEAIDDVISVFFDAVFMGFGEPGDCVVTVVEEDEFATSCLLVI